MLKSFTASGLGLVIRANLFLASLWAGSALAGGTPNVQIGVAPNVTGQEVPQLSSALPLSIPITLTGSDGTALTSSSGYFIGCSGWTASYQGSAQGQATSGNSCPAGMTYDASNLRMLWRPNTNMAGTWQITLSVSGSNKQIISTASFTAVIDNTNVAPTAGSISCTANNQPISAVRGGIDDAFPDITCSVAGFADPDVAAGVDSAKISLSPNSGTCFSSGSTAISFTPNAASATLSGKIPAATAQSCSVSLTVTDRAGLALPSYSKLLTFSPISLRVAGPTTVSGVAGQALSFTPLSASDAQNPDTTFSSPTVSFGCASYAVGTGARVVDCPAGLQVDTSGAISWTPSLSQVGVYSIYFSASASTSTRTFLTNAKVTVSAPIVAPSVTSVSSYLSNGTYRAGAVIDVEVAFSKPVVLAGSPAGASLSMVLDSSTGGASRLATYVSGSGSNTLRFSYVVQVGDQATKLDVAGPITLSGATTLKDQTGTAALLAIPTGPTTAGSFASRKSIAVSTGSAVVSISITTPPDGFIASQATAPALPVGGACSENGQIVQIIGPSQAVMKTTTCINNLWSTTVNIASSGSPQGAYKLTAGIRSVDGTSALSPPVNFFNYSITPKANITTPANSSIVTAAQQAQPFVVSGNCNPAGGTVTISGAATATVTATCSVSKTFSANLDLSQAPNGWTSLSVSASDPANNPPQPIIYSMNINGNPRVAFSSPAANAIVNTAAGQTSATISGTCTNAGQLVSIYTQGGATYDSKACKTDHTWSLTLPFSRLPNRATLTSFALYAKHLTATSLLTLNYDQPPTVSAAIDLATATAPYANFSFSCKATATASDTTTIPATGITYSWTRDGVPIATTQTLAVTSAMITHSLACSATATDSYGQSATATSSSSTVDNGASCNDGTTIAGAVDAPAADGEPVVCKLTVAPWQGDLALLPTFNQLLQLISSVVPPIPLNGAADPSLIDEQSYFISALSAVLEQIYPAPAAPVFSAQLTDILHPYGYYPWDDAIAACRAYTGDAGASADDQGTWRLPTKDELLVLAATYNSHTGHYADGKTRDNTWYYWSTSETSTTVAGLVPLANGLPSITAETSTGYVSCVK